MGIIDLVAVIIVCTSGVALFAVSRHYARLTSLDAAEMLDEMVACRDSARAALHTARDVADAAISARDDIRSDLAQRDHARIVHRIEQIEAQIGMRKR